MRAPAPGDVAHPAYGRWRLPRCAHYLGGPCASCLGRHPAAVAGRAAARRAPGRVTGTVVAGAVGLLGAVLALLDRARGRR